MPGYGSSSSELSQRLLTHFKDLENAANYLVRGIVIVTNLDGQWTVEFPQYEIALNSEQLGEEAILNIPSAFHLFVFGRDWSSAHEIVKTRKDAFTTPGLMGWRAVTLANVTPAEAITHFDEAADAFAADTQPDTEELMRRGGFWSGANQQLWAKYFRARARLIESIREPARVKELLGKQSMRSSALKLDGTAAKSRNSTSSSKPFSRWSPIPFRLVRTTRGASTKQRSTGPNKL